MKISYVEDKGIGAISEDKLLIKDGLLGVFDGATSFVKYKDAQGHTGGFLASEIAKNTFEYNSGKLIDVAVLANKKIEEEMINAGIDISDKLNLWSTTIAVVKVSNEDFDWVQIGDSLVVVVYNDDTFKVLIDDYDHDKEWLKIWSGLSQKMVADIRDHLKESLYKNRRESNIKYGVFNGEAEAEKFLKSGRESLKNVAHILIFTDGLFVPKEDPDEPDNFKILVDLFLRGGLEMVKNYVRDLESKDPNCWQYVRLKQFDDIAAIAVSFV